MLIENDYRGEKHKIRLAYNDEYFSVPENLYIIGMTEIALKDGQTEERRIDCLRKIEYSSEYLLGLCLLYTSRCV